MLEYIGSIDEVLPLLSLGDVLSVREVVYDPVVKVVGEWKISQFGC